MLYSLRETILFLNICRINNLKIINMISDSTIYKFLNIKPQFISNLYFLSDKEKRIIQDKIQEFNFEKELDRLYKLNINFITILDSNYPINLKNIYDPPAIIYYKGDISIINKNMLGIVGTRKPSNYGLWATGKILRDLSSYNIATVSGMALGIDRQVHLDSLNNNINTVGVLASSPEIIYPKSNMDLYKRMIKQVLISEFPLDTNPIKRNFVRRNRLISGLSFATLVIEAQEESGSLITASYALEQNRNVFAIPGNINQINSRGTNSLIKKGAKLVESAIDIIEEIPYINEIEKVKDLKKTIVLNKDQELIYKILKNKQLSINEIVNQSKLQISDVYGIIFELLEKKIIEEGENNTFRRK